MKIQYVIAIYLMRWLINFHDSTFKWTATAGIGIQTTKDWLSQLVNFKNAIWTWRHFRRTMCKNDMFSTDPADWANNNPSPISKINQVRRTRHGGHCWKSKDHLINNVLLWTPIYGRSCISRTSITYQSLLCTD